MTLRDAALQRTRMLEQLDLKTRLAQSSAPLHGSFDEDYRDPVGFDFPDFAGRWLAAFEPVLIPGRPSEIEDTGWVVIVQQRAGD